MQGKLDEAKSQLETAFIDMHEGFDEIIPEACEPFLVDLAEIARQQNDPERAARLDRLAKETHQRYLGQGDRVDDECIP